jgi:hypothetical protein
MLHLAQARAPGTLRLFAYVPTDSPPWPIRSPGPTPRDVEVQAAGWRFIPARRWSKALEIPSCLQAPMSRSSLPDRIVRHAPIKDSERTSGGGAYRTVGVVRMMLWLSESNGPSPGQKLATHWRDSSEVLSGHHSSVDCWNLDKETSSGPAVMAASTGRTHEGAPQPVSPTLSPCRKGSSTRESASGRVNRLSSVRSDHIAIISENRDGDRSS